MPKFLTTVMFSEYYAVYISLFPIGFKNSRTHGKAKIKMKFVILVAMVSAQYNRNLNILGTILSKTEELNEKGSPYYGKPYYYQAEYDDLNRLMDDLSWAQNSLPTAFFK